MGPLFLLIDSRLKNYPDPLGIRQSTAKVIKNTKLVTINLGSLEELAVNLGRAIKQKKLLSSNQFGQLDVSAQKIFLLDSVNYCFWAPKGKRQWQVEYPPGTVRSGWQALVACFDRALSQNIPLLDSQWLRQLTPAQSRQIFLGLSGVDIPLLAKRREFLRRAGDILAKQFGGRIDNLIAKSRGDVIELVKQVIKNFPYFRDPGFYKRAQIFAYDLSLLPDQRLTNSEQLTIFADYRLPQWLRSRKVLSYQSKLAQKVDRQELIAAKSPEEIAIRAATVWVGELLAQKLNLAPALIDNSLWFLAKERPAKQAHHRTLTTAY